MQDEVKTQMNQIRGLVTDQETQMQREINRLVKLTENSERDRKQAV